MKSNFELKENFRHFFFDGYSISSEYLDDEDKIQMLIDKINKDMFDGSGKKVLIPYFNGKIKEDGGVSGVVLGENSHFACHTFCYKNTVFVDYYGDNSKIDKIKEVVMDMFPTDDYDLCWDNEDIEGNFGKHIIVRLDSVLRYEEAMNLVKTILSEIDMTPICDMITRSSSDDNFDIIQPIAESHISIHRSDKRMAVDVFSCKYFDEEKLMSILGDNIDDYVLVNRGIRYN